MKPGLVFDTSAVLNFGHRCGSNQVGIQILQRLQHERRLLIPLLVKEEALRDPPSGADESAWFDYPEFVESYFKIGKAESVTKHETLLQGHIGRLHQGELAVMRLALAQSFTVVLDDKDARQAAARIDLPCIGTVGLLNEATNKGWITEQAALETVREIRRLGGRLPKIEQAETWQDYLIAIP